MNENNDRKIKVLYIDHAAAYPEEQKKYQVLSERTELEILLIRPSKWIDTGRIEQFEVQDPAHKFRVVFANTLFSGYRHRSFFTNNIGRIIKEFQPDILHLFEEANTFFSFQAFLLKRLFSPSIKLIFDNFQNIISEHVDYKFHRLYEFIEKLVFQDSVCATVRYDGSREFLEYRKYNKPIYELPWGTDISQFKRVDATRIREKHGMDGFTIGYIGRVEASKGILLLIEALSKLNENIKLLVIGTGSAEQKMHQLIQKLNLSERVIVAGYVSHAELPAFYSAVDCVVVPTITVGRCKEQFGRVLIEAMACETAVIGSTSGAIPSVIGEAGLIFRENDPDDLTEKIQLLTTNHDLKEKLAYAGKERVLQNYTWQKFSARCSEIYQVVLNGSNK